MTIAVNKAETFPHHLNRVGNNTMYVMGEHNPLLRRFNEEDAGDVPWGTYVSANYRNANGAPITLDEKLRNTGDLTVNNRVLLAVSSTYRRYIHAENAVEIGWKHSNGNDKFRFYLVNPQIAERYRYALRPCVAAIESKQIELLTAMTDDELDTMLHLLRHLAS